MIGMSKKARARKTFPGGVHPPDNKALAKNRPIEVVPSPKQVVLPVTQHIGAPSHGNLKPRTEVQGGQAITEAGGFVSAPVHSPLAGKTAKPGMTTLPNGAHMEAIPVKASGEQLEGQALYDAILGGPWPKIGLDAHEPSDIMLAIQQAGIVGLGGAAFPTHVKFAPNDKKPIDTLLVNGCECEPYLTSDDRLMQEAPGPIISGALLAARAAGATDVAIGVEDNKPEAIAALHEAASGTPVRIVPLETKYPQGGEKQLIHAILRKDVPTGGLPLDVGVVVINVGTAAAIAGAVLRGRPLTHRVVSVTGRGIAQPKNLLAPIGISISELIEFCGGLEPEAIRVVSGGPMMGFSVANLDTPITKGTSGITVLVPEEIQKSKETNCVRCGRCVEVCPMGLVPTRLALAARAQNWAQASRYHITACIECGSCAYECPASIPLAQLIRLGKSQLPREEG